MVLRNYVVLEEGIPTRMHFVSHTIQVRDITDPLSGLPKARRALVFEVDELNGNPVTASFSTLSEKLSEEFAPYLPGERYRNYDIGITQVGTGFRTRFQVLFLPRT